MSEPKENIFQKDIQLFPAKFNAKRKFSFYNELSILIKAGVDVYHALEVVRDQEKNKVFRKKYDQAISQLTQGDTFSESIQQALSISDYELYSLRIGEETGNLGVILFDLAQYYQSRLKQNRKFISALTYPVLIILVSVVVIAFMLGFLVPMFSDLYAQFDGELPSLTQSLIDISDVVKKYWYIGLLIILGIIGLVMISKRFPWLQNTWFRFLFRIPFLGKLFQKMYLSLFCNAMALLTKAKVPLTEAIALSARIVSIPFFKAQLGQLEIDIIQGKPLHQAMKTIPFFANRIPALVKVGEETGQLDVIFDVLSMEMQEEVGHQSEILNTLIEPVIIITLGLVIGIILIALYLPIFNISDQFGV